MLEYITSATRVQRISTDKAHTNAHNLNVQYGTEIWMHQTLTNLCNANSCCIFEIFWVFVFMSKNKTLMEQFAFLYFFYF